MALVKRTTSLISSSIAQIAFNPLVSAALLWALTKAPVSLRNRITASIGVLRDPRRLAQIVKVLKACLVMGVTGVVNRQLNDVALNNGRWTAASEKKRWSWGEGKEIAVVTGGCSGIGELIVKGLVGRGVRVAVLDVRELPASLQGYAHIKFFKCDITDPAAVYATAESVKTALGNPSILINNAGVLQTHTILNTPDEYLRKIFDVNVLSNWYTTKAFLPSMVAANKGHIVTIASTASYLGVAGLAHYNASKAAILSFHETLRQEIKLNYKAPNVLTTSIHPSWVRTPLLNPVVEELRAGGASVLEPQDVADAVVRQVLGCRSGQIFLPEGAERSSRLRGWPNWLQIKVQDGVAGTIRGSVE